MPEEYEKYILTVSEEGRPEELVYKDRSRGENDFIGDYDELMTIKKRLEEAGQNYEYQLYRLIPE